MATPSLEQVTKVFCTTALFTWKFDATDVSRLAGHANYRITLDMYVSTTGLAVTDDEDAVGQLAQRPGTGNASPG